MLYTIEIISQTMTWVFVQFLDKNNWQNKQKSKSFFS